MTDFDSNRGRTSTGADPRGDSRASVAPTRARTAHPLLGAFPLAVMTLATFMVVFTLMMARMTAGVNPGVGSSTSTALLAGGSGASAVTTRTSGAGAAGAAVVQPAVSEGSPAATSTIVTRSSGAAGAVGVGDE